MANELKTAEPIEKVSVDTPNFDAEGFMGDIFEPNREIAAGKCVESLMGPKTKRITELRDNEIALIASAEAINAKMNSKVVTKFIDSFIELRISKDRKGREEIITLGRPVETKDKKGGFLNFRSLI